MAGVLIAWGWVRSLRRAPPPTPKPEPVADIRDDAPINPADLQGVDVACPHCSYNLRDGLGAQCPECGLALTYSTVFRTVDDFSVLPSVDAKTWSPPRKRIPLWARSAAICVAGLFVMPILLPLFSTLGLFHYGSELSLFTISLLALPMLFVASLLILSVRHRRSRRASIARWTAYVLLALVLALFVVLIQSAFSA